MGQPGAKKVSDGTQVGTVTADLDAFSVPVVGHIYSTREEQTQQATKQRVRRLSGAQ